MRDHRREGDRGCFNAGRSLWSRLNDCDLDTPELSLSLNEPGDFGDLGGIIEQSLMILKLSRLLAKELSEKFGNLTFREGSD